MTLTIAREIRYNSIVIEKGENRMSLIKVNLPSKVAMDGVYVPREVISAIKEKDSRFAAMVIEQAKNATSIEQVKKFLKDKTNGIYSRAAQWGLTEWNKVEHSAAQD